SPAPEKGGTEPVLLSWAPCPPSLTYGDPGNIWLQPSYSGGRETHPRPSQQRPTTQTDAARSRRSSVAPSPPRQSLAPAQLTSLQHRHLPLHQPAAKSHPLPPDTDGRPAFPLVLFLIPLFQTTL